MFIGLGTVANVVTVVVGSLIGVAVGHRLGERTRTTIQQTLGLFTLVLGLQSAWSISSPTLAAATRGGGMLVVLGALLLGTLLGSWLNIEDALDRGASWLKNKLAKGEDSHQFASGFVTATLVFCVGPLTILGSLSDGLGHGADQLLVKAVLDGFAAIAFAASLGWGVLWSAAAVAIVQGSLTLLGFFLGNFMSGPEIEALTATGGVLLMGIGIRLAGIKDVRVGDMLPALVLAPIGVALMGLVP